MKPSSIKILDSYCFGTSSNLTDQDLKQLIGLFNRPSGTVDSILEGRASITETDIKGIGAVVVKQYTRGGLIRLFIKKRYLKLGKTRCRIEYEQLIKARELGIRVPKPIAYATKGGLFYRGWLVTQKIKNQQTLVRLSLTDPDKAKVAVKQLMGQVTLLIENRIFHKDLHPGNVLVNNTNETYIIDFDKAGHYKGSKKNLKDRYAKRWNRAVEKYRLPTFLIADKS